MKNLMNYIDRNAPVKSGAFIGLMIAPGIAEFMPNMVSISLLKIVRLWVYGKMDTNWVVLNM